MVTDVIHLIMTTDCRYSLLKRVHLACTHYSQPKTCVLACCCTSKFLIICCPNASSGCICMTSTKVQPWSVPTEVAGPPCKYSPAGLSSCTEPRSTFDTNTRVCRKAKRQLAQMNKWVPGPLLMLCTWLPLQDTAMITDMQSALISRPLSCSADLLNENIGMQVCYLFIHNTDC